MISNYFELLHKRIMELIDASKIKFYISKDGCEYIYAIMKYPYRLIRTDELITPKRIPYLKKIKSIYPSKSIILDSGIRDPSISNEEILSVAKYLKPHILVPKDYSRNAKKTVVSIRNFLEIMSSYIDYDPEILIPLQPPYNQIPKELMRKFKYLAISGTYLEKNIRLRVIKTLVNKYSNNIFHIFGTTPTAMIDLFKKHKNIVSCDTAAYNQIIFKGIIPKGKFSVISERLYYPHYIISEYVTYYNYKTPKKKQKSILENF